MSANVTQLEAVRAQPVESVVSWCEELLERARRGEITAIAFTYVEPGGAIVEEWACPRSYPLAPILGALEILKRKLLDAAICIYP